MLKTLAVADSWRAFSGKPNLTSNYPPSRSLQRYIWLILIVPGDERTLQIGFLNVLLITSDWFEYCSLKAISNKQVDQHWSEVCGKI